MSHLTNFNHREGAFELIFDNLNTNHVHYLERESIDISYIYKATRHGLRPGISLGFVKSGT